MIERFSFYDIVAHIIPGAVAIAIFYWVDSLLGLHLPLPPLNVANADLGSATLFLIISYALGTVAQGIGEIIELPLLNMIWRQKKQRGLMALLCNDDNKHFSKAMQVKLKRYIYETFSLTLCGQPDLFYPTNQPEVQPESEDVGETDRLIIQARIKQTRIKAEAQSKDAWEALALCYSLIIQESAAQRAESYKSILRLFRGTFVVLLCAVLFCVVALIVIYLVASDVLPFLLPFLRSLGAKGFDVPGAIIHLVILAALDFVCLILFLEFAELFPVIAFEDFYAWYELKRANRDAKP